MKSPGELRTLRFSALSLDRDSQTDRADATQPDFSAPSLVALSRVWHKENMQTRFALLSRPLALACGVMLTLGVAGVAAAQEVPVQQPSAREQLQRVHTPQSIEQELARLTKDLELTSEQQQQVRPLLQEHHDRIQALLDTNPSASRTELGAQIHSISDDTHGKIHALLSDHQKELEKAMQQREHAGGENRRPIVFPR